MNVNTGSLAEAKLRAAQMQYNARLYGSRTTTAIEPNFAGVFTIIYAVIMYLYNVIHGTFVYLLDAYKALMARLGFSMAHNALVTMVGVVILSALALFVLYYAIRVALRTSSFVWRIFMLPVYAIFSLVRRRNQAHAAIPPIQGAAPPVSQHSVMIRRMVMAFRTFGGGAFTMLMRMPLIRPMWNKFCYIAEPFIRLAGKMLRMVIVIIAHVLRWLRFIKRETTTSVVVAAQETVERTAAVVNGTMNTVEVARSGAVMGGAMQEVHATIAQAQRDLPHAMGAVPQQAMMDLTVGGAFMMMQETSTTKVVANNASPARYMKNAPPVVYTGAVNGIPPRRKGWFRTLLQL